MSWYDAHLLKDKLAGKLVESWQDRPVTQSAIRAFRTEVFTDIRKRLEKDPFSNIEDLREKLNSLYSLVGTDEHRRRIAAESKEATRQERIAQAKIRLARFLAYAQGASFKSVGEQFNVSGAAISKNTRAVLERLYWENYDFCKANQIDSYSISHENIKKLLPLLESADFDLEGWAR